MYREEENTGHPPLLVQEGLVVLPVSPNILYVALGLVRVEGFVAHLRQALFYEKNRQEDTQTKECQECNFKKLVKKQGYRHQICQDTNQDAPLTRVAEPELEPEPALFGPSGAGAVNLLRLRLRTKLKDSFLNKFYILSA